MAVTKGATPAALFWGTRYRGWIARAALVNGTARHAFEMDDIHKESIVHPNSLAVPVALGFAEALGGVSGRDVLTAIVAGYAKGAAFRHACRLKVATKDGRTVRHERLVRRGSPGDAVGSADIVRKFEANVSGILDADAAMALRDTVDRLDRLKDAAELVRQLAITY